MKKPKKSATKKDDKRKIKGRTNNPDGRPSGYDPSKNEMVQKFCLMGATDAEIADLLKISLPLVYVWKRKYPEFREAIEAGKELADARVAEALYNKALGYDYTAEKITTVDKDGNEIITETSKHQPADTTAQIFWLKNRLRGKWRDRHDHNHSGEGISFNMNFGQSASKEEDDASD